MEGRNSGQSGHGEQLNRIFREKGIKKAKVGFFDVDGVLRGKYFSLEKLLYAMDKGFGFCDVVLGWDIRDRRYDNSTLTGWNTGYPDAWARIDQDTFRVIPWEPDTACFICDLYRTDGQPLTAAPRQILQKVLSRAEQMNVMPIMSAEFEYFLFPEPARALKKGGFKNLRRLSPDGNGYSWLRSSEQSELIHAILDQMKAYDIEIETLHATTGPGLYETALRYDDCLRAADKGALFKTAIKELASRRGMTASFMAKLTPDLPCCRGHIQQSLWDRRDVTNLFYDPKSPSKMSSVMRHYIGGQIALMPQLTALVNPTVNSYKRMFENNWVPTTATWGVDNRSTAVRAIYGSPKLNRIEHRLGGADLNPYIAMAAMLAAGLYGIEHKIEPPEPITGNAYENAGGASRLPRSLEAASALLGSSDIMRELLGDEFVDFYVATREWESRQFNRAVTDWELDRYLDQI